MYVVNVVSCTWTRERERAATDSSARVLLPFVYLTGYVQKYPAHNVVHKLVT